MGIMPPGREEEALTDYGEVIAAMSDDEFMVLGALADEPHLFDPTKRGETTYGEERDLLFNQTQMKWLEVRYGVYFPWKTYVELMPGGRWDEKASPRGKAFTRDAMLHLPKTCAFIRTLPFLSIGSVKLLGVSPHDHGNRPPRPRRRKGRAHGPLRHARAQKRTSAFTCMMQIRIRLTKQAPAPTGSTTRTIMA